MFINTQGDGNIIAVLAEKDYPKHNNVYLLIMLLLFISVSLSIPANVVDFLRYLILSQT